MFARKPFAFLIVAGLLCSCATGTGNRAPARPDPVIVGHRGACGYRPEETIAAYELAIQLGADFIEPDLVPTRDGVLIARHENELSLTTDVAQTFPKRRTRKKIEGREIDGWFSEDFTLAEIKTLRAIERFPFRDHSYDGKFQVITFRELIELAQKRGKEAGRVIGIYPEIKNPSYFASIGLPLEERLAAELDRAGYTSHDSPVIVQSMEPSSLRKLRSVTRVRLMQLTDANEERPYDFVLKGDPRTYGDLLAPAGLREIATYADGIGPWKRQIVPMQARTADADSPSGPLLKPTSLVQDAHSAGLFVHPYTFRREKRFLASEYDGDPIREYLQFYDLGVDGVFSDNADLAYQAREVWRKKAR